MGAYILVCDTAGRHGGSALTRAKLRIAALAAATLLFAPTQIQAQQPTISPSIDFFSQPTEVPVKTNDGVDWSDSAFCALSRVEIMTASAGSGRFGMCRIRHDQNLGWVISTGPFKYLQSCSVICWKQ